MTDQLRLDHTGFGYHARDRSDDRTGNGAYDAPWVETPNIDRIAEGTAFLNCQTVNPICTPARSALMTGKYTHQIGMLAMSGDLSLQHPTYPQALRKHGYETWGIGKFHFLQTWRWGAGRGNGVDLVALKEKTKLYGFDHVWEAAGKQLSRQNYCDYSAYLDRKGLLDKYRDFVDKAGPNTFSLGDIDVERHNGDPSPLADEDHVDYVIADRIVDAINTRSRDKPFFIFGSFCSPHKPYDPPTSYIDATDDYDWTPISNGGPPSETTLEQLRRQARSYRALVRFTDDQIGRVLDRLEHEGLLDNTVVLFTSDHGEMLGDHGKLQKTFAYRCSLTVPTAIRHPGYVNRRRIESPIELTDLTATMLDIAGLDPVQSLGKPWPSFHDIVPCRSLMPLVAGETGSIRDFSFSECNGDWQAIQDDRYKYVRMLRRSSPDALAERFYDLDADPDERVDLLASSDLSRPVLDALERSRSRLSWVNDSTPPAQTRWAPLLAEGEAFSYPAG